MKNIFSTDETLKINLNDGKKYFFTSESVKRPITDLNSGNFTDSDLEGNSLILPRVIVCSDAGQTDTFVKTIFSNSGCHKT